MAPHYYDWPSVGLIASGAADAGRSNVNLRHNTHYTLAFKHAQYGKNAGI